MPMRSTAFLNDPSRSTASRSSARPSPNLTRPPKTTQSLIRGRPRTARPTASARQDAPGGNGVVARAVHHDLSVDDDVGNTHGMAVGIRERRLVAHRLGIEEREVGGMAHLDDAAVLEVELGRGHACHLVHGLLEREELLLTAIDAEDAREGPVAPRVRLARMRPRPRLHGPRG